MTTKTIMKSLHGSHLYGTETPNSDVDYKGIFVNASLKDILLQRGSKKLDQSTGNDRSKNSKEDIDVELYELKTFIDDACSGQTIAVDMLHTPDEFITEKGELFWIWEEIRKDRTKFYNKNMSAFVSYARKQAAKYGIKGSRMGALEEVYMVVEKDYPWTLQNYTNPLQRVEDAVHLLPINDHCKLVTGGFKGREDQVFYEVLGSKYQLTSPWTEFCKSITKKWESYGERSRLAKENEGIDWKALSHAFRAAFQLEEIFTTGDLVYPLKDRAFISQVKAGELDFLSEVQPELETVIERVEQLSITTNLPEKVDKEYFYGKVYIWYKEIYGV